MGKHEGFGRDEPAAWLVDDVKKFMTFAEGDARISLVRAIALIEVGEADMDAVDLITRAQLARRLDEVEAAQIVEVQLTVQIAAALQMLYLYQWETAINATIRLTAVIDPATLPAAGADGNLLHWIFDAAGTLAWLHLALEDAGEDVAASVEHKAGAAALRRSGVSPVSCRRQGKARSRRRVRSVRSTLRCVRARRSRAWNSRSI